MGDRPLVVVTGSAGRVATLLLPSLGADFDLRLVDARPGKTPTALEQRVGDLSDPDFARAVMAGADGVVHLAGNPSPGATWEQLSPANVDLSMTVFEAARTAGVPTVVYASSNHASGRYDLAGQVPVRAEWPARPCCLYGASKAAAETIGRHYADAYGLAVVCLRLGWVRPRPHLPRALAQWLSPGDLGRLVTGALRAAPRFGIYYGVSANTRRRWYIDAARDDLGYQPVDDSEDYLDEIDYDAEDPSPCQRQLGALGGGRAR